MEVTVGTMTKDFKKAKTVVFWDVEDFPNPNGPSIDERIKSGLKTEGYEGEVFIKAYGEKKPENLNVVDGGVIEFITESGKIARVVRMLIDICFWSIDFLDDLKSEPRNLLFIAKTCGGCIDIVVELRYLHILRNFNVLVVVATGGRRASETPFLWLPCKYWNWDSLLAGENALSPEEIAILAAEFGPEFSADDDKSKTCGDDGSSESSDDDLPPGDDDKSKTCVYCASLLP